MIELVRAHPGEFTLVAVGPLTNVALAMLLAEDFAAGLRSLVIMGGVFTEVTGMRRCRENSTCGAIPKPRGSCCRVGWWRLGWDWT